jgi:hypothetical protein
MKRSKVYTIRITAQNGDGDRDMDEIADRISDALEDLQAEVEEMMDEPENFELSVGGKEEFLP